MVALGAALAAEHEGLNAHFRATRASNTGHLAILIHCQHHVLTSYSDRGLTGS